MKKRSISSTIASVCLNPKSLSMVILTCFVAVSPSHAVLSANPDYQVVLGHDGHPDPDDNLATMAGAATAIRNAEKSDRITVIGMIYGDTTQARKNGMKSGGADINDKKGKANYTFFKRWAKPGVSSMGISPIYDTVTETSNFTGNNFNGMTAGGELLATKIQQVIDADSDIRIVYSAGGGENAAAEAIAYLRKQGYTNAQIKQRFAVIQHSGWNIKNATETTAQNITKEFTIRIEDQNKYSGVGKLQFYAEASRTSVDFEKAWRAARKGETYTGIADHKPTSDGSDAGSHHFATNPTALDLHWNSRAGNWWTQVDPSQAIKYSNYGTAEAKTDVCDGACPSN